MLPISEGTPEHLKRFKKIPERGAILKADIKQHWVSKVLVYNLRSRFVKEKKIKRTKNQRQLRPTKVDLSFLDEEQLYCETKAKWG